MNQLREAAGNVGSKDGPEKYQAVVVALLKIPGVSQPSGVKKKGFGSSGLYVRGKMFAFLSSKGEFVVKLPRERVDELVAIGDVGARFDPRRDGRVMKEWFVVAKSSTRDWVALAREAMKFVAAGALK